MSIQSLRERINIWLFGNKTAVLRLFKSVNIIVTILAILTLVYYYGFPLIDQEKDLLFQIIKTSFAFYLLQYIVRIIYDFNPLQLIKSTWFEGIMMAILLIEGIAYNIFDTLLLEEIFRYFDISKFRDLSTIFIQLYFLSIVIIEAGRSSSYLPRFKVHPASVFIASFLVIIFSGTGLLMLPEMTSMEGHMNFVDALFTSTSATCVTGLMVEDAVSFFTFKGQIVILILIKLGGLNIIAFGSFLALASRLGFGIKQHDVIEDFVNRDSINSAAGMLSKVIVWSTAIELIGALLMYFFWSSKVVFASVGEKLFYSVFHSVSAFNNAGISLFKNGLAHETVADNYFIHWIVTILVFFGALGMVAVFDLFDPVRLRDRMKNPWKQIQFPTKIALYFSLWLVIGGSLLYFFLEYDNTMSGQSFFGKITTSVFQSVTRTSGFNTVDIGSIGVPMLFILIILMFIGASSSSTGGGIKTSTLAIIFADVIATIKGRQYTEIFKRRIGGILKSRAYSVLLIFIIGNLVATVVLSISESHILAAEGRGIFDIMFEQVSAMGTVGLSTGITADFSTTGKIVLVLSMLVGRVGTLTVAFALSGGATSNNYKYPQGHTMVG
ncbi:MAG: trk system potassium uptake protein TrkH [Flavobacteriales bacterium]|jgi:trk system potassium uptake protein TrkH